MIYYMAETIIKYRIPTSDTLKAVTIFSPNKDDTDIVTLSLEVPEHTTRKQLYRAIYGACTEFLKTEKGKQLAKEYQGEIGWEFVKQIPTKILRKFSLYSAEHIVKSKPVFYKQPTLMQAA